MAVIIWGGGPKRQINCLVFKGLWVSKILRFLCWESLLGLLTIDRVLIFPPNFLKLRNFDCVFVICVPLESCGKVSIVPQLTTHHSPPPLTIGRIYTPVLDGLSWVVFFAIFVSCAHFFVDEPNPGFS